MKKLELAEVIARLRNPGSTATEDEFVALLDAAETTTLQRTVYVIVPCVPGDRIEGLKLSAMQSVIGETRESAMEIALLSMGYRAQEVKL